MWHRVRPGFSPSCPALTAHALLGRDKVGAVLMKTADANRTMSVQGHRTNPLPREGLAARSGDYVCRSNSLNERR